jgi:hypothetical protein
MTKQDCLLIIIRVHFNYQAGIGGAARSACGEALYPDVARLAEVVHTG